MSSGRPLAGTLRAQLLWWLIPPVLLVVAASSFISYSIALRYANDAYDVWLLDEAKSLSEQIRFLPDGKPHLDLPQASEEMLRSDPQDKIYFRVISRHSGETISGRKDIPFPETSPSPGAIRYYPAEVSGVPVRVCSYTSFDAKGSPSTTVLVAETLVKRNTLSRSLLFTDLVAPLAVLPILMALIIWLGIRRGLRPLQNVSAALSRRGWDDLTLLGHQGAPEEVRPLTRAIDDLMERLGVAISAQRRFLSDAAHQLRTPLAGLAAQTERALLAPDIDTIKLALTQLHRSSRRISRLVNQLLSLARAEPGSNSALEFVTLDLAAVVRLTCMEWVPNAIQQAVDLGFEGDTGPIMVQGNELMLVEMLNNLIDNALRYGAKPGSTITVRLAGSPALTVTVEDDGPGIPEDERLRVFERFHRVPGSPAGGCGLGLAIVRELARRHGAEVSLHAKGPSGGTVVQIVFSGW